MQKEKVSSMRMVSLASDHACRSVAVWKTSEVVFEVNANKLNFSHCSEMHEKTAQHCLITILEIKEKNK